MTKLNFQPKPQSPASPIAQPATPAAVAAPARIANSGGAPRSIFQNIENAKMTFASNYFKDGHYFALIREVKYIVSRQQVPFVIIGQTILCGLPGAENLLRDGEECTHMLKATADMFLGNFKQFVSAVAGCEPDEVTLEICQQITSDAQPLAGMLIEVEAKTISLKKPPHGDFTVVTYKRAVSATEVSERCKPEIADLVLGKGALAALVAQEAAGGKAA